MREKIISFLQEQFALQISAMFEIAKQEVQQEVVNALSEKFSEKFVFISVRSKATDLESLVKQIKDEISPFQLKEFFPDIFEMTEKIFQHFEKAIAQLKELDRKNVNNNMMISSFDNNNSSAHENLVNEQLTERLKKQGISLKKIRDNLAKSRLDKEIKSYFEKIFDQHERVDFKLVQALSEAIELFDLEEVAEEAEENEQPDEALSSFISDCLSLKMVITEPQRLTDGSEQPLTDMMLDSINARLDSVGNIHLFNDDELNQVGLKRVELVDEAKRIINRRKEDILKYFDLELVNKILAHEVEPYDNAAAFDEVIWHHRAYLIVEPIFAFLKSYFSLTKEKSMDIYLGNQIINEYFANQKIANAWIEEKGDLIHANSDVYDYVKNKLAEKGLLKLDVKKSTVDSLVANMTLGFIQPHTTQPTSTLSEEEQQQLELQRKAKEKEEVEEESVEGSPKRHRSS